MTRTEFERLAPGTPVTIYAFGEHPGVVIAINPTVTIQGRTVQPAGWVAVRPLNPATPIYNGTFKDVDLAPRIASPIATAIDAEAAAWAAHFGVTDAASIERRRNVMRANVAVGYVKPLTEFLASPVLS